MIASMRAGASCPASAASPLRPIEAATASRFCSTSTMASPTSTRPRTRCSASCTTKGMPSGCAAASRLLPTMPKVANR
ncbi:MAG: hypothetical protein ACO3CS_03195 [Alphaproteobacteria bacterium]